MNAPHCNNHRFLVRDLALGKLDDIEALHAEEVLDTCEVCAAWWSAQFDSKAAMAVDAAVGDVFSAVELPVRQRNVRYGWAAAAAALVIGVGTIWQMTPGINTAPTTNIAEAVLKPEPAVDPGQSSRMDFESGVVVANNELPKMALGINTAPVPKIADAVVKPEPRVDPGLISRMDFESGVVVAVNELAVETRGALISRMDFESGVVVAYNEEAEDPGLISRWDFESGTLNPNT